MKKQRVFNLNIANRLIKKGHTIVDFEINTNNPRLKVFIFEKTPEFMEDFLRMIKK